MKVSLHWNGTRNAWQVKADEPRLGAYNGIVIGDAWEVILKNVTFHVERKKHGRAQAKLLQGIKSSPYATVTGTLVAWRANIACQHLVNQIFGKGKFDWREATDDKAGRCRHDGEAVQYSFRGQASFMVMKKDGFSATNRTVGRAPLVYGNYHESGIVWALNGETEGHAEAPPSQRMREVEAKLSAEWRRRKRGKARKLSPELLAIPMVQSLVAFAEAKRRSKARKKSAKKNRATGGSRKRAV
jgi:hypothetical protein